MKTKKYLKATANLKLLLILPLIGIALIAFYSCGKNKNAGTSSFELAPPPPPPPAPASDSVYVNVDNLPVFKGGEPGILNFIKDNTKYPEDAKKTGMHGKVIVRFVVEKDCSISQVDVIQSVSPSLDAEAIRVVSSLPKFEKPAFMAGEPVRVHYMIPILFNLK
jgi:protein TonB